MLAVFFLIAGLGLLYYGAEWLVRGGASLALRLGLSPLVVGLTVVAFGTSSPELIVSLRAALADQGAIALGNVVGSNICNVALILGMASLIRPMKVQSQLVRLDVPIAIACSFMLVALLANDAVSRLEGGLLTLAIVSYIAFSMWQARRERHKVRAAFAEEPPPLGGSVGRDVLFVGAGLALLVVGGNLFVQGAVDLARALGLSEAVIGLTIVAFGTSLPELATSVVAALRREGDIAIGNVVGSNIFNILGILGPVALIHPIFGSGIRMADLGVMIAFIVLLLPLLRTGFLLNRWEGGLLLAGYAGYLVFLLQ